MTLPQKIENQKKPTLVYDLVAPTRLRSMSDDLSGNGDINRLGLDSLGMSGIEQFSESQLDDLITAVHPKTVVVIDTRQEAHGFIDGKPVSWMAVDNRNWANVEKNRADILPKEEKKLAKLADRLDGQRLAVPHGSTAKDKDQREPQLLDIRRERVETEKQLVERKGGSYLRVPIPDHAAPDLCTLSDLADQTRLVVREKGLENIHFVVHCRGGMGRTTFVMSAIDMLANAWQVSLHDIVGRQVTLRRRDEGPIDSPEKAYKGVFREEKSAALAAFYHYAADCPFSAPEAASLHAWEEMPDVERTGLSTDDRNIT